MRPETLQLPVTTYRDGHCEERLDPLTAEEPLEMRLGLRKRDVFTSVNVAVTMRTPGQDRDLALGFFFTEGILQSMEQVAEVMVPEVRDPDARNNVVQINLHDGLQVDLGRLKRHFYTSSSCGVCGKASIESVRIQSRYPLAAGAHPLDPKVLHSLPKKLLSAQEVFSDTGGIHAAALFDQNGELLALREDVGRHNALDKLIGVFFEQQTLPLSDTILLVSGRASFELVQKAMMAGIPVLAAVGAPSHLAVELAAEAGMGLVGFLRKDRFNVYTGEERVAKY